MSTISLVPSKKSLVLCELPETGVPNLESFSPFCLKVHRALKAAGLPYTSRRSARPDAFAKYNPARQVPVLLVGDEAVFDSTTIVSRIAELAPNVFDVGLDEKARAEAWLWEEMADTVLGGFLTAARWADARNWPAVKLAYFGQAPWFVRTVIAPLVIRKKVMSMLAAKDVTRHGEEACWTRFEHTLNALEARTPAKNFWMGEGISRADVALFGQLQSFRTRLTPWQSDHVEARPRLRAYLDRVDLATRSAREPRVRKVA